MSTLSTMVMITGRKTLAETRSAKVTTGMSTTMGYDSEESLNWIYLVCLACVKLT